MLFIVYEALTRKVMPGAGAKTETSFGRVQSEFARNLIVSRVRPERSEAAIRDLV
jgi:hypothetical protein